MSHRNARLTVHGRRLPVQRVQAGQIIRRCEPDRPGELIHLDVKKPGRIPDGGGRRIHGRAACTDRRRTYNHHRCHTALKGQPPITRVNNPASQYT